LLKKKLQQPNKPIKQSQDVKRFGFVDVRPVWNEAGEEQFGVIELAPALEGSGKGRNSHVPLLTAGLRLSGSGLNLWLADDRHEREFWQSLAGAVNSGPVQFVLRRRQAHLDRHLEAWEQALTTHLPDQTVRQAFLEDYVENFVLPNHAANPVELWAGLLISGRGEAEVGARLASLFAALSMSGCEVAPLNAQELSVLLLDYYNPCAAADEMARLADGELPLVEPAIGEDALFVGLAQAFWRVAAPPSPCEGGWVRALLEQTPREAEFDLVAHLAPLTNPATETSLTDVLGRRLLGLEAQVQSAQNAGDGVLYHDLQAAQGEMQLRFQTLSNGQARYFEVGLALSLRCEIEELEQLSEDFVAAANGAGLALQLVKGADRVERAWQTCAPLNVTRLPRSFVLPSHEAGRLAQVAATSCKFGSSQVAPLLGLNRAGEPLYFENDQQPGQTALFLTGNAGAASVSPARNIVKYLAAMRYLAGERLLGFDPHGDWRTLTHQLGGTYIGFGPENHTIWHYNPLQFVALPQGSDTLQVVEQWSESTAAFLATILDLACSNNPDLTEQLRSVLVELAFNNCNDSNADEVLTAGRLYSAASAGGYGELATQLARCVKDGDLAWLFERSTKLAPVLTAPACNLLFVGFSPQAHTVLTKAARAAILVRVFAYFGDIPANTLATSRLVIYDDAATLLTEPQVSSQLTRMYKGLARRKALDLWCIGETPTQWLAHQAGQIALEQSDKVFFFKQNGSGLVGAAKRLHLPVRAQRAIRDIAAGGAIVAERQEDGARGLEMFVPIAQDYIARLAQAPVRSLLALPHAAPVQARPQASSEPETLPVIVMPAAVPFDAFQREVAAALAQPLLRRGA